MRANTKETRWQLFRVFFFFPFYLLLKILCFVLYLNSIDIAKLFERLASRIKLIYTNWFENIFRAACSVLQPVELTVVTSWICCQFFNIQSESAQFRHKHKHTHTQKRMKSNTNPFSFFFFFGQSQSLIELNHNFVSRVERTLEVKRERRKKRIKIKTNRHKVNSELKLKRLFSILSIFFQCIHRARSAGVRLFSFFFSYIYISSFSSSSLLFFLF